MTTSIAAEPALAQSAPRDIDGLFVLLDGERCDPDLLAEDPQLLLGRRAAIIERGHQDFLALPFAQALGELGAERGLACALQAHHQDRHGRGGGQIDRHLRVAEDAHQLVMDDLDDLLAGSDRADHFFADGALAHLLDEGLHDFERDVGLEQRAADLAQRRIDVGFAERAAAGEAIEDFPEPVAQAIQTSIHPLSCDGPHRMWSLTPQTPNPPRGASRCGVFASGISLDLCGSRSAFRSGLSEVAAVYAGRVDKSRQALRAQGRKPRARIPQRRPLTDIFTPQYFIIANSPPPMSRR